MTREWALLARVDAGMDGRSAGRRSADKHTPERQIKSRAVPAMGANAGPSAPAVLAHTATSSKT